VHEDELTERILSVSARNIPTEYELTYRVKFSVLSEGKTLIDNEEISATRDISFDEAQLLAKETRAGDPARGAGARPGGAGDAASRRALGRDPWTSCALGRRRCFRSRTHPALRCAAAPSLEG
jgi:hypothetical protein